MRYYLFILLTLLFVSCSSNKQILNDDAVRIKIDSVDNLEKFNPYVEPNTGQQRNPSTLRGNVFNITKFENETGEFEEYVVFLDSVAFNIDDPQYEYIPISLVDLQGPKIGQGNNWFENYNNPLDHDAIREVDTLTVKDMGCGCSKITCPDCNVSCPFPWQDRAANRQPIFLEANLGIATYSDNNPLTLVENGFDRPFGEFAIGYRFQDRSRAHFALGLSYFTGIMVYEQQNANLLRRDALMLYGKYTFDEWACIFPYVYGQIGASLDVNSFYMGNLAIASKLDAWFDYDCGCDADLDAEAKLKQELAFKSPEVDFELPISIGFGAGLEFPVSKYFDISIDLGYKYMKIGETIQLFDYNVPVAKPMSIYTLRLGIHY